MGIVDFFSPCDLGIWRMPLKEQLGTSSGLHQALCIFSKPSVSSVWSYSLETLNSGQNQRFCCSISPRNLSDDPENNGAPLLYTSSLVHHFKAIGESKLELQSGNAQIGSKSAILCLVRPWNLMDDLEKQKGTSRFVRHFKTIVNSSWSISPEIGVKIGDFLSDVTLNFYG